MDKSNPLYNDMEYPIQVGMCKHLKSYTTCPNNHDQERLHPNHHQWEDVTISPDQITMVTI